MIRRLVFALAVMSGAIYWAHCTFHRGVALSPSPDSFFAGCFRGPVIDPAGLGDLTIVLEAKGNNMLGGCIWWPRGVLRPVNGTLAGTVDQDATAQAHLRAMSAAPVDTASTFRILVRRAPAGDVSADTVTVTNLGGGLFPFTSTAALPHCPSTPTPPESCADLGLSVPFLPGGGMP